MVASGLQPDGAEWRTPMNLAPLPAFDGKYLARQRCRRRSILADAWFQLVASCHRCGRGAPDLDSLANGGNIAPPLSELDQAKLFGMVVDRFSVPWLILAQVTNGCRRRNDGSRGSRYRRASQTGWSWTSK
jgi:hypothetical protein